MKKIFLEKTREATSSVLPITVIVFLLGVLFKMPVATIMMFLFGALLLVVGMIFFSIGVDLSIQPLGEDIGAALPGLKKFVLLTLVIFIIGFIVTVAEPDLVVLATLVPSMDTALLVIVVSAGVGISLVLSILRLMLKIPLSYFLIAQYAAVFILSVFVPKDFLAIAFDFGGVTTGPVTTPFVISLGVSLSVIFSGGASEDESFGFIALCSIGPVFVVMLLSIIYPPAAVDYTPVNLPQIETMNGLFWEFANHFPAYALEVLIAAIPIMLLFVLFQAITGRYKRLKFLKMSFGFLYKFSGLILFLTGVNVGFIPVGNRLGVSLGASEAKWLLVPIGMLIGYFVTFAEPAIHVLNKEVEDISGGAIPQKAMMWAVSIGVAVSAGLTMIMILTSASIYYLLLPGYAAALALTFFVPKIFTGIAFDSGGVASGTLCSAFILPFAMGACEGMGGDVLRGSFGVVAIVAMAPLVTIQIMGLFCTLKTKKGQTESMEFAAQGDEVFDFDVPYFIEKTWETKAIGEGALFKKIAASANISAFESGGTRASARNGHDWNEEMTRERYDDNRR